MARWADWTLTQLLAAPMEQLGSECAKKGDGELVDFHVAVAAAWMKLQHPDFSIARTAGLVRRFGQVLCRQIDCIPVWDV